jgi:DNA polymerase-1
MNEAARKMMILDGNSIVNRAFYGIRMLNAPDGTPTNGVYGFLAILQRLLEQEKPDGLCVTFDVHAPTFRHEMSQAYKAQRKPMPEELRVQMPLLKEVLDAMGVRRYELAGWEADDLLGTMAQRCEQAGWDCRLVTGDKDSFQLITDKTHVIHIKTRMGQTETIEYDPARFETEYGFAPIYMIDLKALMGDTSDNIPGVPGIGEKTALGLLHEFGSLDGVYEHLDDPFIKTAARKKLTEGETSARLSYTLATIRRDAPIEFGPDDGLWHLTANGALYDVCKRLGFGRFIEKWGLKPDEGAAVEAVPALPRVEYTAQEIEQCLKTAPQVAVVPLEGLDTLELCDGQSVFTLSWTEAGFFFNDLLGLLFSPAVTKISHNGKDLMGLLLDEGLSTEGFVFDTALAGYLLDATASDYSLPRLSQKYLGREADGAEAVYLLRDVLAEKLEQMSMHQLYYDIELPLCPVLAEMEKTGFLVDRKALYDFGQSLTDGIAALQKEIWALAGNEFNINSPKQLGQVLFERLGLPAGKKTRTGWSTNADILERLRDKHPIVDKVLEYRELSKLKSTYADGLLKTIAADGRIHTSFQMTVTDTGRLSSREPNLQNIPVRRELGAGIRRMFVAGPGNVLVDADYSQIELRLLAHMSGDETMINAFLSGEDIHAVTASQVFGLPLDEVTSGLRAQAKAVNFGIVYGISAFSLSQDIGVTQSQAKAYIETYMEKYHGVREYMESAIQTGRDKGYVSTLFGRRRAMPELSSSNFNLRSFGERVARNMPIQGTAADVMKLAMIRVHHRLRQELPQAKLLLQVHDELIVECPADQAEAAATILRQEMENAVSYTVPLTVDCGVGASWADAH